MNDIKTYSEYLLENKIDFRSLSKEELTSELLDNCSIYFEKKKSFFYKDVDNKFNKDFYMLFPDDMERVINLIFVNLSFLSNWEEYPKVYENLIFRSDNLMTDNRNGKIFTVIPYDVNNDMEDTKIGYSVNGNVANSFSNGLGYLFGKSDLSIKYFDDIMFELIKIHSAGEVDYVELANKDTYSHIVNDLYEHFNVNEKSYEKSKYYKDIEDFFILYEEYMMSKGEVPLVDYITKFINPDFNMTKYEVYKDDAVYPNGVEVWTDSPCIMINIDYKVDLVGDSEIKIMKK